MSSELGWNIAAGVVLALTALNWWFFGRKASNAPLACPLCEKGSMRVKDHKGVLKVWWCDECNDTTLNHADGLY